MHYIPWVKNKLALRDEVLVSLFLIGAECSCRFQRLGYALGSTIYVNSFLKLARGVSLQAFKE